MSQRLLLGAGVAAIAVSLLIGALVVVPGVAGMPAIGWFSSSSGQSISMDAAQRSAQAFLDRTGNPDLKLDEMMEFDRNFYALVKEKSTGVGAFELLVDRTNGSVGFEPGPDMMWNTKYGMMGRGGMMGRFTSYPASADMPVSPAEATGIAQSWLDTQYPGDTAGTADAFYGYYTFHFERAGRIAGMLSVNGYTGQVWFHSWHGAFVAARDFGA